MGEIIQIVHLPLCYPKDSIVGPWIVIFPFFLFILPYLPFVGITENVHADRIGKIYYFIPFVIGALGDVISRMWTKTTREYIQCLTSMHTIYAYPCYEISVAVSYCLVEIMYYWPSYVSNPHDYVRNVWYLSKRILLICIIGPLSVLTYTANYKQVGVSILFGFLTIPMFLILLAVLESVWYAERRQAVIDYVTEWWNPPDEY